MFIGTVWALTYKQHMQDVSRPIAVVAILLLILSTVVSVSCFLHLLSFANFLQAHCREHNSCWRWTSEVSQHVPGWTSGVLCRPYPTNSRNQECGIRLANSTGWRGGGELELLYAAWIHLVSQKLFGWRFIDVMLYGDQSRSSSYRACCGAVLQVSSRSCSRFTKSCPWRRIEVTGFYATYSFLQVTSNSGDIYVNEYGQPAQWVTAFFSLTIATNLLSSGKYVFVGAVPRPWTCLGLLAYRIWVIEHDASTIRAKKDTMMPIVRVLMDSAILYSVALLTALICYVCSNDGEVTITDMVIPPQTPRSTILTFEQLDRTDHIDCLLHGPYSHRDQ